MNKTEKQQEIDYLTSSFSDSQIALCADFRGLTVMQISQLRDELRKGGSYGRVVKNTLAKISAKKAFEQAEQAELEKFIEIFQGPNFVIFSKGDPVGSAKALTKFAKDFEKLEIRGGWFEGTFIDEEGIKALSNMPSREELLAKLLSLLNAPAVQLLQVMKAPARQFVQLLGAYKTKLEEQK